MKKLHEAYRKLVKTMDDQRAERDLAAWDNKQTLGKKLRWQNRAFKDKNQDEVDLKNKLCDKVDELLAEDTNDYAPAFDLNNESNKRLQEGQSLWYEGLLQELLKERRKIPKADRLKQFRNDSVDEIDTSDMEAYLTGKSNKRYPISKAQAEEVISSQIIKGQLDTECLEDP